MRWLFLFLVSCGLVSCSASDPCDRPTESFPAPPRHTPRWAFEPWISKDISSTDDTYAFVDGFRQRDIPVGVVVLDSPWETHYNTFVPNPVRYHDFEKLIGDLHAQDIRLVLWVTQMINNSGLDLEPGGDTYDGPASNFAEAQKCGYFVNDGETYLWWKGTGGALDFFDARASNWWHRQQDPLLRLGIDGWKLDFGDSYLLGDPVGTKKGPVAHQQYSESYYHDFLAYGVARRGSDFLTMVRGWDASYNFTGRFYARPEDAPVVWAGDNRRDWIGLADALDTMFRSARAGYVVVGSDVGGYLNVDDKTFDDVAASQTTFARWTAIGALGPFMQLHGRANLTPWTIEERPDETVDLYRYWAKLHHELVPFFYSLAEQAYAGGPPILEPIGDDPQVSAPGWSGDYRFTVGGVLLVAPILDDSGVRDVALPAGARWYDWWTDQIYDGGTTLPAYDATDRRRIPLFVKEGAILPMRSSIAVWPSAAASFTVEDEDGKTTVIANEPTGSGARVHLSRVVAATTLRAHLPSGVVEKTIAPSDTEQIIDVP
jgi:alpha-glucosidase (family GH31 glycosyl hydrolase)